MRISAILAISLHSLELARDPSSKFAISYRVNIMYLYQSLIPTKMTLHFEVLEGVQTHAIKYIN